MVPFQLSHPLTVNFAFYDEVAAENTEGWFTL